MRVLFLRLGSIGDVVQCAVAITLFKKKNPQARIDWAVGQSLVSFVKALGVADRVISINYDGLVKGSLFSRLKTFFQEASKLSGLGLYQKIANAHADYRYNLLTRLVKVRAKSHLDRPYPIVNRYRVYECLRLLTNRDPIECDINFGLQTLCENLRLATANNHEVLPCNYVVLVPGGAKNLLSDNPQRRWPIDSYVVLAKKLRAIGLQVVVAGGATDSWIIDSFNGVDVINLVGKTDLMGLFRLMDNAEVIVAHDSGPLHLAMVTGSPLVGIFGPTPANAVVAFDRPYTRVLHMQNRIACSPCYDGRTFANCSDNKCMSSISVDTVFENVAALIRSYSIQTNEASSCDT